MSITSSRCRPLERTTRSIPFGICDQCVRIVMQCYIIIGSRHTRPMRYVSSCKHGGAAPNQAPHLINSPNRLELQERMMSKETASRGSKYSVTMKLVGEI